MLPLSLALHVNVRGIRGRGAAGCRRLGTDPRTFWLGVDQPTRSSPGRRDVWVPVWGGPLPQFITPFISWPARCGWSQCGTLLPYLRCLCRVSSWDLLKGPRCCRGSLWSSYGLLIEADVWRVIHRLSKRPSSRLQAVRLRRPDTQSGRGFAAIHFQIWTLP